MTSFTSVTAQTAASFDASVGINIHPGYAGTEYANTDAWLPQLLAAGFEHVRTNWYLGDSTNDALIEQLASAGIKVMITSDWLLATGTSPEAAVDYLVAHPQLAASIYEIEGPNEINANYAQWQETVPPFIQELYTAFKANPVTAHILVTAPSFDDETNASLPAQIGNISQYVDEGDIHGTNGGEAPTDPYFTTVEHSAQILSGTSKPLVNSEGGYSYGTDVYHAVPLPPSAVEIDVMHYYLENYSHGIVHADLYQFLNQQPNGPWGDDFGLLDNNYQPTPAYNAIQALTTLLKDPGAASDTSFTPGSLTYSLQGTDANTRSFLVEKSDGTFWLAVWEQEQVFTYNTADSLKGPVNAPDLDMTLQLSSPATGAVYMPDTGSTSAVASFSGSSVAFTAGAKVALIEITPKPQPAADTLVIHASGDQWNGDPEFTVFVDGHQVGGPFDVSASHAAGQWQDFTLSGDFTNAHQVQVVFTNDAWGGTAATDRNLYVGSITVDGQTIAGHLAADTASNGNNAADPGAAVLMSNGSATFTLAAATSGSGTSGSGSGSSTPTPDTLVIDASGDQWQGDPQFTVAIDGQQVGGPYDVSASHAAGQDQAFTITGDFSGAQHVQVAFINDGWGGTSATDRNLYVSSISFDGNAIAGNKAADTASNGNANADPNAAVLMSNGTATFDLADAGSSSPPPPPPPPQTLVIHAAGDQWQGDPHFTVSIDGKSVGGTYDVSAVHSAGQWQDFTIAGDFSSAHQVAIAFTNDAWGGTSTTDRNLYIGSITLDGETILGTQASDTASNGNTNADPSAAVLMSNGTATFTLAAASPLNPASSQNGHDSFVISSLAQAGSTIANFDTSTDTLDLRPFLHSVGYVGTDPFADHALALVQSGSSTEVNYIPPGGEAPNGETLVTLAHVLPSHVQADIIHA
jgi:hypothetical protein